MNKFLLIVLLLPLKSYAHLQVTWFGVASLLLEDTETKIFFDPMFTRANAGHWLGNTQLKSDEVELKKHLKKINLNKLDALFASHSHFDHVIDAPILAKLTGGVFFVDQSSEIIAKAYKDSEIKTKKITKLEPIQIGKFKVTPFLKNHASIQLFNYNFLPGQVSSDFNFYFYDYKVGDNWFYLIEHPAGKILIDQGSESFSKEIQSRVQKVDVLIQGIANRKNDEMILEGHLKTFKPRLYIPIHFDNFFFSLKKETSYLPGIKIKELEKKIKKQYPMTKYTEPDFGNTILLK